MCRFILAALAAVLSLSAMAQQADPGATAQRVAEAFITARVSTLPPGSTLQAGDVLVDDLGQAHVRYQHFYQGLPVFESELIVHVSLANETVLSATDALLNFTATGTQPVIQPAAAHARALRHLGLVERLGGRDDLMILVNNRVASLAWRVRASGDGTQGPLDKIVFVDARSGSVLRSWDNLQTTEAGGMGYGFFNGTVPLRTDARAASSYRLLDPSRGGHFTCDMRNRQASCYYVDDADNYWGNGTLTDPQTVAVDAQYGTGVTWDYYALVHGRSGIANDGKGTYNRVHYGRKYNNAYWSDSCRCMTYGDGDGVTFNPFDSLDVAGHEMTHGVTSRTANLTYSGESGGLNEATSDIFGTMVEYYANNPNDPADYLVGERLYKSGGKALRYMYRPSKDGKSADCWYSGLGSLNVHYSSGVANHFYYLLAEGTGPETSPPTSPTCGSSDGRVATGAGSLAGIGRAKAEKIWYRALTVYMTASTNYANARVATANAAADLYGANSAEAMAVSAAWTAVKVN